MFDIGIEFSRRIYFFTIRQMYFVWFYTNCCFTIKIFFCFCVKYPFPYANINTGLIFKKIPNNKVFVEIGLGYYEFNSLNLIKNNWSGLLIEQNFNECLVLRKLLNFYYPESKVKIINKSINKENINRVIFENLESNNIDFFSIDIDGNDYWVLKNLNLNNISCVCLEYNHWLGPNEKKTIPYNENHNFKDNGYFGASLLALNELMNKKDFKLISIESSGTNAFFVKNEFAYLFEILDPIKSFKSVGRLYSEEQKIKILKDVKSFNFEDV